MSLVNLNTKYNLWPQGDYTLVAILTMEIVFLFLTAVFVHLDRIRQQFKIICTKFHVSDKLM